MNSSRHPILQAAILLVARILMALPLIEFGTDKVRNFGFVSEWMRSIHLPASGLLLGMANTIELVGALCLIVGFWTRRAGLIIALYLIPVTVIIHNFWAEVHDSGAKDDFGKGMMIIGGLIYIFVFGAGSLSVDNWLQSRNQKRMAPSD